MTNDDDELLPSRLVFLDDDVDDVDVDDNDDENDDHDNDLLFHLLSSLFPLLFSSFVFFEEYFVPLYISPRCISLYRAKPTMDVKNVLGANLG